MSYKTEECFKMNSFNKPETKSGGDADALLILRGAFKTKQNPMLGDLNFDIEKYRYQPIDTVITYLPTQLSDFVYKKLPDMLPPTIRANKTGENSLTLVIKTRGKTTNEKVNVALQLERKNIAESLIITKVKELEED